jgi:hypothetical protein
MWLASFYDVAFFAFGKKHFGFCDPLLEFEFQVFAIGITGEIEELEAGDWLGCGCAAFRAGFLAGGDAEGYRFSNSGCCRRSFRRGRLRRGWFRWLGFYGVGY